MFCIKNPYHKKHTKHTHQLTIQGLVNYERQTNGRNRQYPEVHIDTNVSIKQKPRPASCRHRHSLLTRHSLLKFVFLISLVSCVWKLTHHDNSGVTTADSATYGNYSYSDDDKTLFRQKRQSWAMSISKMFLPDSTKTDKCHASPIKEFPNDFMSHEAKEKGGFIVHIFIVIYALAAISDICLNYFVPALENICEALSLQSDVSGATFMAVGTSAPEMFTHFISLFFANDDFGIGTVVGSAIFNLLVVISCCGIFGGMTTQLSWFPLTRDTIFYIIAILELITFIEDGDIVLWESTIMVLSYIPYIVFMVFNRRIEKSLHYFIPDNRTNLHHRNKIKMIQARSRRFFIKGNKDVSTMKSTRCELIKLGLSNEEAVGYLFINAGPHPSRVPSNISSSEWESVLSDPLTHREVLREMYTPKSASCSTNPGSAGRSSGSRKSTTSNKTHLSVTNMNLGKKVSFKGSPQHILREERPRTFFESVVWVIRFVLRRPQTVQTDMSSIATGPSSSGICKVEVEEAPMSDEQQLGSRHNSLPQSNYYTCYSASEKSIERINQESPQSSEEYSKSVDSNKSTNKSLDEDSKDQSQTKNDVDILCVESPTRFRKDSKVQSNRSSGSSTYFSAKSDKYSARDPDIVALRRWSMIRKIKPEALEGKRVRGKSRHHSRHHGRHQSRHQSRHYSRHHSRRQSRQYSDPEESTCCAYCWSSADRRASSDDLKRTSTCSINSSSMQVSSRSSVCRQRLGSGKMFKIAEWIYQSPNKMIDNPFKKPKNKCKMILWIIRFPILLLHYLTVPKTHYSRIMGGSSASKLYIVSFCLSIVYLGIYCYIMLWMSAIAGYYMKVPDSVIGVTILASGTSVPNLFSSVMVAKSGYGDMAVSNVIGSNVFDILLGLGLPWTVYNLWHTTGFKNYAGTNSALVVGMTLSTVVIYIWGSLRVMRWRVTKHYGIFTMMLYFVVVGFVIYYEWGSFSCFGG